MLFSRLSSVNLCGPALLLPTLFWNLTKPQPQPHDLGLAWPRGIPKVPNQAWRHKIPYSISEVVSRV